jgi:hypothetical protein
VTRVVGMMYALYPRVEVDCCRRPSNLIVGRGPLAPSPKCGSVRGSSLTHRLPIMSIEWSFHFILEYGPEKSAMHEILHVLPDMRLLTAPQ